MTDAVAVLRCDEAGLAIDVGALRSGRRGGGLSLPLVGADRQETSRALDEAFMTSVDRDMAAAERELAEALDAELRRAAPAPLSAGGLGVGQEVVIEGLRRRAELNGTRGTLLRRSTRAPGAWRVRLEATSELVLLKQENLAGAAPLTARAPPQAEEAPAAGRAGDWGLRQWEAENEAREAHAMREREAVFDRVLGALGGQDGSPGRRPEGLSGAAFSTEDPACVCPAARGRSELSEAEEELEKRRARRRDLEELERQREKLRRRFDRDSEDADGADPFGDATSEQQRRRRGAVPGVRREDGQARAARHRSKTAAADLLLSLPRNAETQRVVDAYAAAARHKAPPADEEAAKVARARAEASFDAILSALEAEKPPRPEEGAPPEDSELAEVLRVLDEAAAIAERRGPIGPQAPAHACTPAAPLPAAPERSATLSTPRAEPRDRRPEDGGGRAVARGRGLLYAGAGVEEEEEGEEEEDGGDAEEDWAAARARLKGQKGRA